MSAAVPWPVDPDGPSRSWRQIFDPGSSIVVSERWHGLLWAAEPHTVVSHTPELLVTALPHGTAFVVATNRGMDYTAAMTREQRKRAAMATRRFRVRTHRHAWTSLHLFAPASWAQVWFSWDEHGDAVGYYVNFQAPAVLTADGLETKDLALDALVRGDTWTWKDEEDFDEALRAGLFPAWTRARLLATAAGLRAQLRAHRGVFDPARVATRPDVPPAALPVFYAEGGPGWAPTEA